MDEAYIGMIIMVAFDFAPPKWEICDGRILSIAQNQALFSLLGTRFGGNGQTTFGLPDLRGRMPIGMGMGPGLTPRQLGDMAGQELTAATMPAHSHTLAASTTTTGLTQAPAAGWTLGGAGLPGRTPQPVDMYSTAGGSVPSAPTSVAGTGSASISPATCLNFIICTQGLFPSRQ